MNAKGVCVCARAEGWPTDSGSNDGGDGDDDADDDDDDVVLVKNLLLLSPRFRTR